MRFTHHRGSEVIFDAGRWKMCDPALERPAKNSTSAIFHQCLHIMYSTWLLRRVSLHAHRAQRKPRGICLCIAQSQKDTEARDCGDSGSLSEGPGLPDIALFVEVLEVLSEASRQFKLFRSTIIGNSLGSEPKLSSVGWRLRDAGCSSKSPGGRNSSPGGGANAGHNKSTCDTCATFGSSGNCESGALRVSNS